MRPPSRRLMPRVAGITSCPPEAGMTLFKTTVLVHQSPVAVLDLEHPERREIEAEMIGRRHVHDAAGADEVLGPLDLVSHLRLVGPTGALHGFDHDHQDV